MQAWINDELAQGTLDLAKLEQMLFQGSMEVFRQILRISLRRSIRSLQLLGTSSDTN